MLAKRQIFQIRIKIEFHCLTPIFGGANVANLLIFPDIFNIYFCLLHRIIFKFK